MAGLGVWQLQRRVEKHALIAQLDRRLAETPGALPPPSQWGALDPAHDEFRRVSFTATYQSRLDAMVYSSGSSVRDDVSGPGTWAFLPARLADGDTVAVNAGFVPNTMQDRDQQDRAVAQLVTHQPVMLTGYLRFPEAAGVLTPAENQTKRLWFTRDHLAMAQALGWDKGCAVLYRPRSAGAGQWHPETRPAYRPTQGRPPAIRHHLVRTGRRRDDRVRRLAPRATAANQSGMTFLSNRHPALSFCLSMIFSENRYTLFGIMLYSVFERSGARFA